MSIVIGSRIRIASVLVALSVSVGACASAGGYQSMAQTHWREDMGRMNQSTMASGLDKVFRKYALQLAREVPTGRELYYESRWIPRELLATEEAGGTTAARNRVVIRGHLVGGTGVYRFTWDLENEVTTAINDSWHPERVPPEVIEQFRPMYSDLTLETRTGIR